MLANLVVLYLDHHYGTGAAFATDQFAHLGWVFGVPQLYVLAIPVLGVVSDVVATMAGVRQAQRGVMMTAIAAFGVLSFGAYAQPAFNPLVWNQALYVGMGVLIVLPVLGLSPVGPSPSRRASRRSRARCCSRPAPPPCCCCRWQPVRCS